MSVDNLEPFPEFDSPPVTETVLAVGLAGRDVDLSRMIGFWSTLRDEYPDLSDQPPYQMRLERFDRRDRLASGLEIDLSSVGRVRPRLWLKSKDETRILQLQHDWVAYNWRKPPGTDVPYPRYGATSVAFSDCIEKYFDFLGDDARSEIVPTQCEVTYVNTILPCAVWSSHADAPKVFTFLAGAPSSSTLTTTESINHYATRRIEVAGKPVGRLHVTVSSTFDTSGNPAFILDLTARGEPLMSRDREGAFQFFDLGRETIVRTFPELTTSAMHEIWGRTL